VLATITSATDEMKEQLDALNKKLVDQSIHLELTENGLLQKQSFFTAPIFQKSSTVKEEGIPLKIGIV
jgi:hypothetical protein